MTRATLRRALADGTVLMLVGTVLAGIATYGWQMAGTRVLGEVEFAPVATVWTAQFLVVTILLAPLEQFTIRTIAAGPGGHTHLRAALPTMLWVLAGSALALTAVALILRDSLFQGGAGYALVCGAIVIGFGQLAVIRGVLAGQRDFAGYGYMTAFDSIVRLAVAVPLLLAGASALAYAWTIPASTLVALLWLRRRRRRLEAATASEPPEVSVGQFIVTTVSGSAAAQIILAGGPLVLALLHSPEAAITTLFVTQTAFRAAFMIATPGWSRVLPAFTRLASSRDWRRLERIAEQLAVGAVIAAAVAGALAALVAPAVIEAFFGGGVRPSAFVAGMVAAGTTLAVGNLGFSQILIAAVRTHRITGAWWGALLAAGVWVAIGPADALERVTTAFVLGEVLGMLGLALAARFQLASSMRARARGTARSMQARRSPFR